VSDARDGYAENHFQEAVQVPFQPRHNVRKLGQRSAPACDSEIVDNGLDTQDAFAFGIHLDDELTEIDLEHRQIIRRSLDHDLQSRRLPSLTPDGALLGSKGGL
jgi:hypothetical protein